MPWTLLALLAGTGTYAALSDVRNGLISNRFLGIAAVCGSSLDVIFYGFVAVDCLTAFLVNVSAVAGASVVLFCAHIWAGGDTKLACTCAILVPAPLYLNWFGTTYTLIAAVLGSFLLGYAYLLGDVLRCVIRKKKTISWGALGKGLLHFVVSYMQILVYLVPVNLICTMISVHCVRVPEALWFVIDLIAAWAFSRARFSRRLSILMTVLILDIVLSISLGRWLISTQVWLYVAVFLVAFSKLILAHNIYETIPTEAVESRMILATVDTIKFQKSRVMGLPPVSTEDLQSRLTDKQAASVRRWGATDQGSEQITIVRKVPMGVFIAMAFMIYAVAGWIR